MGQKINEQLDYLASNVFVDQMIFAFVIEDYMYFLGARATDVRT